MGPKNYCGQWTTRTPELTAVCDQPVAAARGFQTASTAMMPKVVSAMALIGSSSVTHHPIHRRILAFELGANDSPNGQK